MRITVLCLAVVLAVAGGCTAGQPLPDNGAPTVAAYRQSLAPERNPEAFCRSADACRKGIGTPGEWVSCMARSGFPRTDPVDGYRICGAPARR